MDYLIIPAIFAAIFICFGSVFLKKEKIKIKYGRGNLFVALIVSMICFALCISFRVEDLIFSGLVILIGFNVYNSIFGVFSIIILNRLNKLNTANYTIINSALIIVFLALIIVYRLLFSLSVINSFLLLNFCGIVFVSFILFLLFSFFAKITQLNVVNMHSSD